MSTDTREERLARRIADLYANDRQFADARPSEAISAAIERPGLRLPQIVRTVMEGYADRPALAQRAVQFVNDPQTGRTSVELLPRFETTSYRELWDRVGAVATALAGGPSPSVRPGDRVCVLGFTSVDYTIIDVALVLTGAVCVPLQTSAPVTQLRPIVAETEPSVIAASVTYLDDAVELALTGHAPARLVVFDYHPEVDDQRETFDAARSRLAQAGSPVSVETLADVLDRGKALPAAPVFVADEDDPLTLLIYTSGSTGAPKGAMQPERLVANFWRKLGAWGQPHSAEPWITLSFMPMSHLMARGSLYGTLGNGGTAYFAAKSDLSTFLDDLALVRPTRLDFVPRIWDMLFGEFQSELDRRSFIGVDRAALEATVMAEQRQRLLGGRFVSAMTGSAPISAETRAFVESFLDLHLAEGYGCTEAGAVFRRWSGATPTGDRLQAGRRARSGLLRHRPATSQRRTARQNGRPVSRLLQAAGGHRRSVRPGRLLPHRRHHGRGRSRSARVPRPPQQRAEALARRIRHRLEVGGGVRRQPAGRADLRLRQQRTRLPAGGRRAHSGCTVAQRRRYRVAQAAHRRLAEKCREGGRPAVLRDPARLHRRDNAVHAGERSAHRHPQAGAPEAQGALRSSVWNGSTPSWPIPRPTSCARCATAVPTGRCCRPSAGPPALCWAQRLPICVPTRTSTTWAETRCPR